jgi:hypothetical protein
VATAKKYYDAGFEGGQLDAFSNYWAILACIGDSGVFGDLDRDLREFREVLGESPAIQSSRGKEIEWDSQDPMILGGA